MPTLFAEFFGVMYVGVSSWWACLCGVGCLNILAWALTAAMLKRRRGGMSLETYAACRVQLVLSAAYVFGCAFRSALPVYDIPRVCLVNIWLSSVIVGRSVATIAVVRPELPTERPDARLDEMVGHFKRSKWMAEQEALSAAKGASFMPRSAV